jgi:2,5-furandicarboxylate decarboxylase 1
MSKDLRSYLKEVENRILYVNKEVDVVNQVGELISQANAPIMFTNLKDYPHWRMCDLLVKTRDSQAVALGTTPDNVVPHLAKGITENSGTIEMVNTGPVKEQIFLGEKANLFSIPIPKNSDVDAGRYIGSGMCITKDPETGLRNVACLRIMIKGERHTAFMMVPRHTWRHLNKYEKLGKPMPMAVAIGHHPAYDIAANVTVAYGVDELQLASSLMGEPARLVKCETIDMEVPADSEIVIEGTVLPGVREEEGPFGEFTCFISGEGKSPVWDVSAITMRHDPIFRHVQATEFTEHQVLCGLPMEAVIYSRIKDVNGGIELYDVHVPPWASQWVTIVQMTAHYEGQVKDVLMNALSSPYLHPKIAIAVDPDVNIYDPADMMWAISTRVNPAKDVTVLPDCRMHPMDVACPQISPPGESTWQRIGGKMMIDATMPSTFRANERKRFRRCRPMGWGKVKLEDFLK